MKNFILLTFFFLSACSKIDFVHETSSPENILKNKTVLEVRGDDSAIIKRLMYKKISKKIAENRYILEVTSNTKSSNLVINENQTATHLEIEHNLKYVLYKTDLKDTKCIILTDNKTTKSDYIIKSEGYNFGSEINKKTVIKKNIENNLLSFLSSLKSEPKNHSC